MAAYFKNYAQFLSLGMPCTVQLELSGRVKLSRGNVPSIQTIAERLDTLFN